MMRAILAIAAAGAAALAIAAPATAAPICDRLETGVSDVTACAGVPDQTVDPRAPAVYPGADASVCVDGFGAGCTSAPLRFGRTGVTPEFEIEWDLNMGWCVKVGADVWVAGIGVPAHPERVCNNMRG